MVNNEISYSAARENLKKHFDKVCEDHEPLLISRRNGDNIVVVSEEDYRALEETAYLSKSPKNLKRLLEALSRESGLSLESLKNDLGI